MFLSNIFQNNNNSVIGRWGFVVFVLISSRQRQCVTIHRNVASCYATSFQNEINCQFLYTLLNSYDFNTIIMIFLSSVLFIHWLFNSNFFKKFCIETFNYFNKHVRRYRVNIFWSGTYGNFFGRESIFLHWKWFFR